MHVKAKKMAFGGLMLALTVICMLLGSVVETNTLFLLAAASFFVGIIIREFGWKTGAAFYLAGVLLGMILAPNKLYVVSYAGMGLYILLIELIWDKLGRIPADINRKALFWTAKYLIFNLMYIPGVLGFQKVLFSSEMSVGVLLVVLLIGQVGLFVYDWAYEYMQRNIWSKIRGKIL